MRKCEQCKGKGKIKVLHKRTGAETIVACPWCKGARWVQ